MQNLPPANSHRPHFLVLGAVTNLASLRMPRVAILEILSRCYHRNKAGPQEKGDSSSPSEPALSTGLWQASNAVQLLGSIYCSKAALHLLGKKQSRWKFPVGWSWPRDHCLDDTPPRIRAIHSLQQTDWPYCPLLQHSSVQSPQSVIKHSAMWAHFIACAWVGTKPWRKIWPCHAKQRNTWVTLAST